MSRKRTCAISSSISLLISVADQKLPNCSNFTSEERSGGMRDFVLSELFRFNEPILARHFLHQHGVQEFVQE